MQRIIITPHLEEPLSAAITAVSPDRLFVLVDENTFVHCWPIVKGFACLREATPIVIAAGDVNKGLRSVEHVWTQLQRGGATRHSLMVNLGGGMVTDLGGFAASCFKRGIEFVNIPTTLLAMVDASVGGKTGVNFGGLKNEVGVFSDARCVLLSTRFLATLDNENIRSGYAEMLKHGLISDERTWAEVLAFDIAQPDFEKLSRLLADSVEVKKRIVEEDPHEKGLRKALNVGHTVGHALESWAMRHETPVLHGHAVALGMVVEMYLSAVKKGFPTEKMRQTVNFVRENYSPLPFTCRDYPELLELMMHDKKNTAGRINFTLLSDVGQVEINQTATQKEIEEALDFLRGG